MKVQASHPMFPDATHDEQSRQNFVRTMRLQLMDEWQPETAAIYRTKVRPAFERANGRPPKNRSEVRKAMNGDAFTNTWGALLRTTQEMLYDTVGPSIERQHGALMDKARRIAGRAGGSVRSDPNLTIPKYHAAVDIHTKPGGYHSEFSDDDIFAGAEYDRTVNVYLMGMLGPNNDDIARSLIGWIREEHPGFTPRAILDMGCTVGHSTLAYCDAWRDAEIHAIDIGGPCVRYAHARAESMGKRVHFSQQNAEHTDFADGSFDLVVSHIMMHETSNKALANIFAESRRLVRPGGIMLHADGVVTTADPFDKYMAEWMAHHNNEPFLGTLQDLDLPKMAREAGFSHNRVFETRIPSVTAAERNAMLESTNGGGGAYRHTWYTIAATK